ncbi:TPA: hypothetical protein N0F65_011803 [Lagenidium giganteum]|uniref:AAA+ ATPase domain-containing protein n=1 Tax=Lagenidium giganteum TaxID=4803 RepID=A0AAV2YT84_9STRA|nr:TPA: hypothetical protein N0F65_011803 [Lagenidium giganteum]
MQELKRRHAFAPAPEVRAVLQDLQHEYTTMVQYQKAIKDMKQLMATRVKRNRTITTSAVVNNRRASLDSARTPVAANNASAEPMEVDNHVPLRSRIRRRSLATTSDVEQPPPVVDTRQWRRPEPLPTTTAATTTRVTRGTTTFASARPSVRGKENLHRNSARRGAAASSKASDALQRGRAVTKATAARQKRRESLQSAASSCADEEMSSAPGGLTKYSELAKEQGWVDQELIESIERDIVDHGEPVTFEAIAGLGSTKDLLREAVMLPRYAPHLFKDGMLKPHTGILLFGPPGTGKTLLAKAVAHECKSTFFNVSASTLSSKFRGDSEKMVRILFDMAKYYQPSIIFMDEIDAIAGARGGANEHEASRRVKTELLVQLNGMTSDSEAGGVMLLAATNLPWELDEAMRRRLTKRVYVPLPDADARLALFELNLKRVEVAPNVQLDALVSATVGYSGDDITNVCETAKRMPVKRLYTPDLLNELRQRSADDDGNELKELEKQRLVVTKCDFEEALRNVSTSVGHDQLQRFTDWEAEFGSR